MKMTVEIFKTNVNSQEQATALLLLLQYHLPLAESNFDLDDCDRILRIKAEVILQNHIEQLLNSKGFSCTRLE